MLGSLSGSARSLGILDAAASACRTRTSWSPPSWRPGDSDGHAGPQSVSLSNPACQPKPGKFEVFQTDVRVRKDVRLVICGDKQIFGHLTGADQSPYTPRRSTTHSVQPRRGSACAASRSGCGTRERLRHREADGSPSMIPNAKARVWATRKRQPVLTIGEPVAHAPAGVRHQKDGVIAIDS